MIVLFIKFKRRDTFYICGYSVETCLETCEIDLSQLWRNYDLKKDKLFNIFGFKNETYGLMWHTENRRYCYLIGIEADKTKESPAGAYLKCIPGAKYSIAYVPPTTAAADAWTEFHEKALPISGHIPDAEHGMNFEYYPYGENGPYQLWTPVINML